jgi:divalent metal cation (Fe/Co/Zn/Cd) transporter
MQSTAWAFGVLAAAFVFEAMSMAVAVRSLQRARRGRSLREYLLDNRDPTILTVVLEDSSALISIVLAAGGLVLAQTTGWPAWDGVSSIAIGLVLVTVAGVLALENYSLLMGESAPREVLERILAATRRDPAVVSVEALRTMHLGPASLLVVLDVAFRDALSAHDVEIATERLRATVAQAAGEAGRRQLVVIEPRQRAATTAARAA